MLSTTVITKTFIRIFFAWVGKFRVNVETLFLHESKSLLATESLRNLISLFKSAIILSRKIP